MSETAKRTLKDLLSQSFDIFNNYGKDPEALASTYQGFELVLAGYDEDKILKAFQEYLEKNETMPTPAAIKKIIDWDPLPKSAESRAFDQKAKESQKEFERYQNLSPEQKKQHDETMAQIRAAANPEAKQSKGPGKLDYSHWDSMPPEAKELAKIKSPRQAGA